MRNLASSARVCIRIFKLMLLRSASSTATSTSALKHAGRPTRPSAAMFAEMQKDICSISGVAMVRSLLSCQNAEEVDDSERTIVRQQTYSPPSSTNKLFVSTSMMQLHSFTSSSDERE